MLRSPLVLVDKVTNMLSVVSPPYIFFILSIPSSLLTRMMNKNISFPRTANTNLQHGPAHFVPASDVSDQPLAHFLLLHLPYNIT